MRELVPTKITSDVLEHIRSKPGRGHINEEEIREVLRDTEKKVERNKSSQTADYYVRGTAQNGKKLVVCVILKNEGPYRSEVVTAWEVE